MIAAKSLANARITFIGGGNMATAMLGGLIKATGASDQYCVVEPIASQRQHIQSTYQVLTLALDQTIAPCDVIVLAVKPQQMQSTVENLRRLCQPWLATTLIISIAAGVLVQSLSNWLDGHERIIRAMPNTPALVGMGIAGLASQFTQNDNDKTLSLAILESVGKAIWFDSEQDLDSVTALSGSGPAYVFHFLEVMQTNGIKMGLSADTARQLAIETFIGAAQLARQSPLAISELREQVTSKGGTTAAALNVMNAEHLGEIFGRALFAAKDRADQLARGDVS